MPVTTWITLFTLTVPSSWIAAIAALTAAYAVVRIRAGKEAAAVYSDAAFLFVVIWKLSYAVFHFGTFIKSPLSLLYYNGGLPGAVIGLLWALLTLHRKGAGRSAWLLTAAVLLQAVYQTSMALFNEGGLLPKTVTIGAFTVLLIAVLIKAGTTSSWTIQLAILFPVVHLFVAAVQPDGFTGLPLLATGIFSVYFIFMNVRFNISEREAHG